MANVNALLSERLNPNRQSPKMAKMAQASATGNLTSFSGIFSISDLSDPEKQLLEKILEEYTTGEQNPAQDLPKLIQLTSEVKAINTQAIILHGERIKKAHDILIQYKEGAFTTWLIATYGNRQTPYNFMQYYELHTKIPKKLHALIDSMPKQAVYTLASREGDFEKKLEFIETYQGETKTELLAKIRSWFPLPDKDKRQTNVKEILIQGLTRLHKLVKHHAFQLTRTERNQMQELIEQLSIQLNQKITR
ncbi:pGP6-D family virulence protein [Parachlamydia sp. AcF125]|uniref:pGP6-D family virulence protein n=1 Tax=Parachlamydia sp. AcF125 TaxID=2795736 RepID=UPI001BC960EA|nr:pGP6-D family virulence protein [Parachlamydia sp. AcF125]MBS4167752.1 hypothetical protein [Parachlamydia sp. AcF125]